MWSQAQIFSLLHNIANEPSPTHAGPAPKISLWLPAAMPRKELSSPNWTSAPSCVVVVLCSIQKKIDASNTFTREPRLKPGRKYSQVTSLTTSPPAPEISVRSENKTEVFPGDQSIVAIPAGLALSSVANEPSPTHETLTRGAGPVPKISLWLPVAMPRKELTSPNWTSAPSYKAAVDLATPHLEISAAPKERNA